MSIEELKSALLGKEFPDVVELQSHQRVLDVPQFLKTQFIEVENWKKDLEKCPAYLRLIAFYKAVSSQP
ncbi:hypothetical protein FXV77_05435 [Sphingobacterium phlebotomi]|uniref:DUF6965 domain-containing protein n=1 Tax=Sphingobacterium phlebotomi TaxID=2605433 RepID=A0A5D4H9Y6_9SPHI|nr:hypothetical protein [Sphingobacterium phlebotomi]TYR37448.1 hypothetical protein FXV77_05435 [Sphingobacterium phlebotomi]